MTHLALVLPPSPLLCSVPPPPPHPASANHAYLDLKLAGHLDNPDQRISEDVKLFLESCVSVAVILAENVISMAAFAGVLWSILPSMVFALVVYSLLGTVVVVRVFGRRLMALEFEVRGLEGRWGPEGGRDEGVLK